MAIRHFSGDARKIRPDAISEIVAVTFRNRLCAGKSYNPGAFQRIVKSVEGRQVTQEALINRLQAAFRIEERNRCYSYWGA